MTSYSLFSGVTSGLSSTYSLLAKASTNGVTPTSIASAMNNSSYASYLNSGFASYIMNNFSALDADKDGKLSAVEMNNLSNTITSRGLTAAQLSQLGTASGLSGQTLEQVLAHFSDIDKNGDGKVTSAEISAYKIDSSKDKKKTEFANRAAANQSVFYGDENASTAADSSSIISYKYWNDGNNS